MAAASLMATPAAAAEVTAISLEATGGAGFAADPFLLDQGKTSSGLFDISVSPRLSARDERGEATLEAFLRSTRYASRFGSSTDYGLAGAVSRDLDEDLTARGNARLDSSIISGRQLLIGDPFVSPGAAPDLPALQPEFDEIVDPDLALSGERQRRVGLSSSASILWQPYPEDNLAFSVSLSRARYPGRNDLSDYRSYEASFGFSRRLSALLTLGLDGGLERIEYEGELGTRTFYRPGVSVDWTPSPSWRVGGNIGGLFIASSERRSRGIAAALRACWTAPRGSVCANFGRDGFASGLRGATIRTSLNLTSSYQLNERERLVVSAAFGRSRTDEEVVRESSKFTTVSLMYDKRLTERLSVGLDVNTRNLRTAQRDAKDVSGRLFLRMRFENLR